MKRKDNDNENKRYETAYKKALETRSAKDFEDAMNKCAWAISVNWKDCEAWKLMGDCLYELGRNEVALAAYNTANKLCPNNCDTLVGMANALHMLGYVEDACNAFKTATEINPQHFDAWENLGYALCSLKRVDEGNEAFDRAYELSEMIG